MMVEENPHNAEYDDQAFGSAFKRMGASLIVARSDFAKEVHQPSTEHHDHDDEVPAAERVTNFDFLKSSKRTMTDTPLKKIITDSFAS